MNVVDSHLHVNFKELYLSNIIEYLDRERIDRCWLLSWEEVNPGPWFYQHLSVEDIYEAYLKYPSRIVPFYAPDPHSNDAAIRLETWNKKGIRGCGEFKATVNWNSGIAQPLLQTANRLKMPLVFHMQESEYRTIPYSDAWYDKVIFYGLKTQKPIYQIPRNILRHLVDNYAPLQGRTKSYVFPGYMLDFASLEVALLNYPDINFIAHGPMFWKNMFVDPAVRKEELPKDMIINEGIIWRLLRDYPNLYADTSASGLSAFVRDRENTKRFLSIFENKLLYATDNFLDGQREFLDSLMLAKTTYRKIYCDNALRLVPQE